MVARYKAEQKKPHNERYIHGISTIDGTDIIVTMHPELAMHFHVACAILHDFTYKRLHGEMKEWEVTIWNDSHNMRMSLILFYSFRCLVQVETQ